ncbi:MAG: purine-nucleoside phosphorylase [Betaproteobacteria bacterium]|nr:purine-nucleoside phosphorylase [Betaproteobacteria bacterium]
MGRAVAAQLRPRSFGQEDQPVSLSPVQRSAEVLLKAWGGRRPKVAVVLGSGWAGMVQGLQEPMDVPYADLPAFPPLGIAGHAACVRLARLPAIGGADSAGPDVMWLMGRQHAYETGDATAMRGAVQTVAAIGCTTMVVTNAAGSLHSDWPAGSLMALRDHLNLVQRSPLQGLSGSDRFVDMGAAYDADLRRRAIEAAATAGAVLQEGVYAWMMGPQFETPAEIRMLKILGADAVGMSTVPETIAARHSGLRVLAISLMTNMAAGLDAQRLSHEQTLTAAAAHEQHAAQALRAILHSIAN